MADVQWKGFVADADNLPISRPGCYVITNLVNGKVYVGISRDVAARLSRHTDSQQKKLGNAIRKQGLHNFRISPVAYSIDEETYWLPSFEEGLIRELNSIDAGYNILASHKQGKTGKAFLSAILEGRSRESRSEQFKILNADPEFRAKVQKTLSDPDLIARRNKSIRTRLRSTDYRKAQSDRLKEINTRPEVKARKRIAMQEVNSREEVREKHRQNTSQLIWITDGSINKRIRSGAAIPDGFRLGRVCPNGTNRPGKRWITNGTRNLMIPRAAELPEGFRNGKIQQGAS